MNGRIGVLGALLALQLVVIAAVLLMESGAGEQRHGPWLDIDAAVVDEIRIHAPEEPGAVLRRDESGWRLENGQPADGGMAEELLAQLEALRAPWPVATSGGAADRFEVSEDVFQRRVLLTADGDVVAEFYLGTSPGYQQVHARRAGSDDIYSVALSNYQLPAEPGEWLDKTLLQPQGSISAVARNDAWSLERGEQGWLVDGAAADPAAAQQLMERLQQLRVTGLAEVPAADAVPRTVLTVTDQEGPYRLAIHGDDTGSVYTVTSDRRDGAFTLPAYVVDRLVVDAAALKPEGDEQEPS